MKIIAHRGDSAAFGENTPASWNAAFDKGAYAIEADIRFSADGIGIVAHDPTLERLFGRAERADALSFDQLAQLRSADGEAMSQFSQVLSYAARGQRVVLDLKDESETGLERLWADISAQVQPEMRRHIIAGCHGKVAVDFFVAKGGVEILGFIPKADDAIAFYRAGAKRIRLWESDVTQERVEALQAAGAEVWVTSGEGATGRIVGDIDEAGLAALKAVGIDGVLVNDVSLTKSILESLA